MIIPPTSLSIDTLDSILEEFITREGTDYGLNELSLQQKVERLRPQLMKNEVLIIFDETTEQIQLIAAQDYGSL